MYNRLGDNNQRPLAWITLNLGGAFVISFLLLTMFFWAGMRYTADFIPMLTILSIIGFWQGYRLLEGKIPAKNYYVITGITLAGISIVISTLLTVSTA